MSKLNENIKARREELEMSQDELARRLKYKHRSSINKIELGINDVPSSKIKGFAVALQTTIENLMGYDEAKNADEAACYGGVLRMLIENLRGGGQLEFVQFAQNYTSDVAKIVYGKAAVQLLDFFAKLNDNGKQEALKRLGELTAFDQYTVQVGSSSVQDENGNLEPPKSK